jgi:hypothetical protein
MKTKTQRARLQRPSPTAHAADHPGETKKGHDGRYWLSEPDKNGVYRWKRETRVVMDESDFTRLQEEGKRLLAAEKPTCAHCKETIAGPPAIVHSPGKPDVHYHTHHLRHRK